MAAKVRGITIEIGGDASGLEKALKDVNSSIKSTQSQLKDVNKLLKLDPGNAELLAQKQKLLGQASEETANKLKILQDAAREAAKALEAGEIGEEQYDALQREVASCEIEMKKLKEETDSVNSALGNSGTSLKKFADGAQTLADKTKAISTVAAGVVAGLGAMAVKAAESADDILTLSRNTGLATDTIQAMRMAAEQIDVPVENIESAITKLKANLDGQADTWNRIGVSVKDASGNYRQIEDIFNDTVTALGEIENETERDTLAMDLFGKSANELSGLLDDGGKAFKALYASAQSSELLISEEDLKAAVEFKDTLDAIKTKFAAAFSKSGAKLAESLVPIMETLAEALGKVAECIGNIPAPVLKVITVITLVIACISPLLSGIASMIAIVPSLVAGISAINAALATLLANPVVLIIAAIVVALIALGVIIYEVAKHWDEISAAATDCFNAIKGKLSDIGNAIKNIFEKAVNTVIEFPERVRTAFSHFKDVIKQSIVDAFQYLIDKAKSWGQQVADNFTSGIRKMIDSVKDSLKGVIDILDNIINKQGKASSNASNLNSNSQNSYSSASAVPNYTAVTSAYGNYNSAEAVQSNYATVESINSLTKAINEMNATTNVNVTLQGDAKGVFKLVRQENTKMINATGFHALA